MFQTKGYEPDATSAVKSTTVILEESNILPWAHSLKALLRSKDMYVTVQQQSSHLQRLSGKTAAEIVIRTNLPVMAMPDVTDDILYPKTNTGNLTNIAAVLFKQHSDLWHDYKAEKRMWEQALGVVCQTVSMRYHSEVDDATTAGQAIDRCFDSWAVNADALRQSIKTKIDRASLLEATSMENHVSQMDNMCGELIAACGSITESEKMAALRKSVRGDNSAFESYIDASVDNPTMTYAKLKAGLIRIAREKDISGSNSAFSATSTMYQTSQGNRGYRGASSNG
jgi:hypothetical protein